MEEELKCVYCSKFYSDPMLLPCSHSMCSSCALKSLEPLNSTSEDISSTASSSGDLDYPDVDKLSIISEADSGVVCISRPSSYVSNSSIGNLSQTSNHQQNHYAQMFRCPVCKRPVFIDDSGIDCLQKNRVMEGIVEKYLTTKQVTKCQLCQDNVKDSVVFCEQCEVYYCDECKENCHPARGPFLKHSLVEPNQGKNTLTRISSKTHKTEYYKCNDHPDENLSMFCMFCKIGLCYLCAQDPHHTSHDVQPLGAMCKAAKTELSQNLQELSERARAGTEFIQKLKAMTEQVQDNCSSFETHVISQCDVMIEAIEQRKKQLLSSLFQERDHKVRLLKEQAQQYTVMLQRTTGLLQFCIEALKEGDALPFIQVSGGLIHRVGNSDKIFNKNVEFYARTSPEFELTLDNTGILRAVNSLNFFQLKAPGPPSIIPSECSAENNCVTIVWQPYLGSVVEAYTLELDDGKCGEYRVVYVGREAMCTVDGLHFNSIYNARVKAHNHCGESLYSLTVSLQTAEVAWFAMDVLSTHPEVIFTNNNLTAKCNTFEPRVIFGNIGLSKGIHYWEWRIDRYEGQADPSFGIARFDTAKDQLLGKDDKSWSMYIDCQRSWFLHHDTHSQCTDGGIKQGDSVGVLLNLDRGTLSYFINDTPHGPLAFTLLKGVFFPAASINRGVQVSLATGLDPPTKAVCEDSIIDVRS